MKKVLGAGALLWFLAGSARSDTLPSWTIQVVGGWSKTSASTQQRRRPLADIARFSNDEVVVVYANGGTSGQVVGEWLRVGTASALLHSTIMTDNNPSTSLPTIRRADPNPIPGAPCGPQVGMANFFVVERGYSTKVVRAENCSATGKRFVITGAISGDSQGPSISMYWATNPITGQTTGGGVVLYGRNDNVYARPITLTGTLTGSETLVYDGATGTKVAFSNVGWNGVRYQASFTLLGDAATGCHTYSVMLQPSGAPLAAPTHVGTCDWSQEGHYTTMATSPFFSWLATWSELDEAIEKGLRLHDTTGAQVSSVPTYSGGPDLYTMPVTPSINAGDPNRYYALATGYLNAGRLNLHSFVSSGWDIWHLHDYLDTTHYDRVTPLALVALPDHLVVVWRDIGALLSNTYVSAFDY